MDAARAVTVAVVGYGYWGPNLVRNVMSRPELALVTVCERDPERADAFRARVRDVPVTPDLDDVLADPGIDAVVVATPPSTHHPIVKAALQAGKHVLVEKPMARTSAHARELIDVADRHGVLLMPGHTFLYSPAVNKVRELILEDALGEVYFVTSSRMNLGKYQADGVICDLAPHDISILLHWLDRPVVQVAASSRNVFQEHVAETAFISLSFAGGTAANLQVSWLAPSKVRTMMIVGSRRMVSYDDTSSDESVKMYDRGMEFATPESFGEHRLTYRSGDVIIPRLDAAEPLGLELQDFARAIVTGARPRSHAELGHDVVVVLEAVERSVRLGGEPVVLELGREAAVA
jgi:predicted dehydrogenase